MSTLTLDLYEAALLLKVHPKTLQGLARRGAVPACKIGRAWVFVEHLLIQMLVAQSTARTLTHDSQGRSECRSTDARTPPTGGSNCRSSVVSRSLYSKALGLPTDAKRSKSTTGSRPLDGNKSASA